jgi:hypothetical protein
MSKQKRTSARRAPPAPPPDTRTFIFSPMLLGNAPYRHNEITGPPINRCGSRRTAPLPSFVNEFISSEDGLRLIKAFVRIARPAVRRRIVQLVQEIAST